MMNALTQQINISQILITKPIIDAAIEIKPNMQFSHLSIEHNKSKCEFKLIRMENMMNADFEQLLLDEPIKVKPSYSNNGKPFGKKINGVMKPMYEIIDGRHRICRILILQLSEIDCLII